MLRSCGLTGAILLLLCAQGCLPNPGGANRGAREAGNGAGGVVLGASQREIAVDAAGRHVIYRGERLRVVELSSGRFIPLEGVPEPRVVAFWAGGGGFFGLTAAHGEQQQFVSFDLEARKARWVVPVQRSDRALRPLAGGKRLLAWGTPGNARLVDAATGRTEALVPIEGALVDVDELPTGELLLTEALLRDSGQRGPRTALRVVKAEDGADRCRVEVENCADETVVVQGKAFLAPTFCGKDPVSVVDLAGCRLSRTLPGFGPVAAVQQGRAVVAFLDRDAGEGVPEAVRASAVRYHLARIDVASLSMQSAGVGDFLPRYAPLRAGDFLLLDTAGKRPVQPRAFDLERMDAGLPALGPAVPLEAYVISRNDRHVYLLSNGLYDLRVADRQLDSLPLPFVPEAINITPDGGTVMLLEGERLHVYEADTMRPLRLLSP